MPGPKNIASPSLIKETMSQLEYQHVFIESKAFIMYNDLYTASLLHFVVGISAGGL